MAAQLLSKLTQLIQRSLSFQFKSKSSQDEMVHKQR